jgi:hypothetical protein
MRRIIFPGLLFCSSLLYTQEKFQLARPLVKFESVFFKDSAKLELKFAKTGAKIYYTIEHKMPAGSFIEPSQKSFLYKKPIIFKSQFTTIRAKVFCKEFIPSETVEYHFAKEGKKIKKIISTPPNPEYPGTGDITLFDNNGGVENSSSITWMGFDVDTISFTVELAHKETVNTILLSFLQNEDSWIFLPELILVYYFDESKEVFVPFGREALFFEKKSPTNVNFHFIFPKLDNIKAQKLLINLMPVKKIPDWHPAKGQHAWCFIDEIKVY